MPRRKRESLNKPIVGIDMTPLMDLTFMLLIVFVITVPVMEYATDVTPPEMTSDRRLEEQSNPLVLALTNEGNVKIDDRQIPMFQLDETLQIIFRGRGEGTEIMVRADGQRPYSEVITLMRAAKNAGFKSISLMTQAEQTR